MHSADLSVLSKRLLMITFMIDYEGLVWMSGRIDGVSGVDFRVYLLYKIP